MSFSGNIILLDSEYENIQPELNNCLTDNTTIILYDKSIDNYETIKNKLQTYKEDNNIIINGIDYLEIINYLMMVNLSYLVMKNH